MAGAAPELRRDLYPAADDSRVIECSSAVLQSLRLLVLERFNQLPHGGTESFGVLFGTRREDELRITAVRLLPAGTVFATSSALTKEEREAFRNLVLAIRRAPDLDGLEAVGWVRAHPRSGLDLSQRDLEISTSLFPEIWQVAMVVRPGNSTPSCVRVYFRDSDGALHADRAFREFTVPIATGAPEVCDTEESAKPDHGDAVSPSHYDVTIGIANQSATSAFAAAQSLRRHIAPLAERLRRTSAGWLTIRWPLALVGTVCVVGVFYWVTRPPKPLALLVQDSAGQLVISWDKTIRPVQNAPSAHLEIGDGSSKLWLELDREQLRMGNVTYKRRSGDVTVRLVVPRPAAPPLEEMARFLGPIGQQPASVSDAAGHNRPSADTASGIKLQASRNTAFATRPTTALLVPVPIDRAEPSIEAAPKFTPPSTNRTEGTTETAAPELVAPPQLQHQALSTPWQARPELPADNFGRLPAPAPPPAAAHIVPTAPATGRILWIGRLQKNQTLKINGKTCSTGTLIGELPLRPVKFSISPGDLSSDGIVLYTSNLQYANSVVEPPGAQNGWNRTIYTWNPRFANDIVVQEPPAPDNGWSRIVLRGKNPKMSVIVIDWALVN
jgi:proteasome lid subunit RPN8/RPN11